jgi:agmatine deiminase
MRIMAAQAARTVTVGLVQARVSNNLKLNLARTAARIRQAARMGAQVICLQELYRTRYFPVAEGADAAHLTETIPGESTAVFSGLAKKLNIVIIVPLFEADATGKRFNSAVVIDADGSILGTYRKVHIPQDPLFYEQSYFEDGDSGFQVFRTQHLCFSVLICYDQWFPEAARISALQGAEVIFYPTAIGYLADDPLPYSEWLNAWETIQRGHAIANSVHVAVVNRVGAEGALKFWGSSFVSSPFGKILKRAGSKEDILVVELDLSQNGRIREGWRFMKNRHPSAYAAITEPPKPDTPRSQSYSMPAEWERHEATWLAWPHDRVTFPRRVQKVEERYAEIIKAVHADETVNLFVTGTKMRAKVQRLLRAHRVNLSRIRFFVWDYADVWFRDYGPTFIRNEAGNIAMVHWNFNAWGGKYEDLIRDGHIPYFISEKLRMTYFRPGIVLEGGSIDVNGAGSVLTTEQCLLNEKRNPGRSRSDLERYLAEYLNSPHVIWLKSGIAGDDTDGHIDNLARFVSPSTVLCAYEPDERDENHVALKENYDILLESKDQDGAPLEVVKMPMPAVKRTSLRGRNRRLPASYLNFYIANGAVLAPVFGQKSDDEALGIIRNVFPDREVVGIDCSDLVYGSGALHCITQQQPL